MSEAPTPKDIAGSVGPKRQTGWDKWVESGVVIGFRHPSRGPRKAEAVNETPLRHHRPAPVIRYSTPPATFVAGGLPGSNRRSRGAP